MKTWLRLFLILALTVQSFAQTGVPLNETILMDIDTTDPTTSRSGNADITPTCGIYEDTTDTLLVPGSMTLRTATTGEYRMTAALTAGNGFEVGKWYTPKCYVTIGGIPNKVKPLQTFRVIAAENTEGTGVVDVSRINNIAATSVTTINANQGTTQPLNFTGTAGSALAKTDMVDIAGAAVSTSTAQLGVNVVNFGGSAGTFAAGRPEVNTARWNGTAPSNLISGRVDATVGAMQTDVVTAASIAADAIGASEIAANAVGASELATDAADEIGSNVWAVTTRQLTGTQTFNLTGNVTGNLSGSVGSVTGAVGSVTGAVGSVTGAVGSVTGNIGGNVNGNVNGTVGSVTGAVGSVTGNVGGNVTGTIGGLTAAALANFFNVDSHASYSTATSRSVVKEIADNSAGASLTNASISSAVWNELLAGHTTVGSSGKILNNLSAATDPWSQVMASYTTAGTFGNAARRLPEIAAGSAGGLFIAGSNAATTVNITGNLTGNVTGSVGSVTGAVGSVTGAVGSVTGAVGSVTGNLLGNVLGNVAGNVTGSVGSVTGLTNTTIGDAVWDEAISGHLTAGTTGLALNSASSAGDPWSVVLPGVYAVNTAGAKLGRVPDIAAGSSGGLFIAGTDAATTVNITGNLIGSVSSVSGNVDGNVTGSIGTVATNGITANSIAANTITSAKIAADAIGATQIAAGAITSVKIANDAIGANQIAADAIGASEIADNAIDAGAIAAGAITSSEAPNLDVAVSTRGTFSVKKSTAFKWPMHFVKSTDHVTDQPAVAPVCTRAIDSISAFGGSIAATTTTTLGYSEATVTSSDMNGDQYMVLRCTAPGADTITETFKIEAP